MNAAACDQVRERLPEWVAGELSDEARAALATHLEACAECRAEAALVTTLRQAAAPVPVGLEGRVLLATRGQATAWQWGFGRRLALAATLAGAVLGGVLLFELLPEGSSGGPGTPVSVEAGPGVLLPALEGPVLTGGSVLPSLTETELELLLSSMEL